ncbi:response regulator [Foetidibacter luteolus]|uniref:response regulator n=1 Tax=Foetidibacter luteolus TaxID=2608880 RepID=UPI00129B48BF|nr:response regulator [Foetidibacter luteolus]
MQEEPVIFNSVLIAEDSVINQIFIKRALQKVCARIDVAENGAEAVAFASNNKYDLILMDLFMPELDGYTATEKIRKELGVNTPIIAITAVSLPGEEQKCIECGMNGYFIKPFTQETIAILTRSYGVKQPVRFKEEHVFGDADLIVDLTILYALGDTTPEYIGMMINVFTDNMEKTIDELNQLLRQQKWDELQKKAHFAKSSLSVIKINALFEIAKDIDMSCRSGKGLELIPSKISRFEELFNRSKEYLKHYIENLLAHKS